MVANETSPLITKQQQGPAGSGGRMVLGVIAAVAIVVATFLVMAQSQAAPHEGGLQTMVKNLLHKPPITQELGPILPQCFLNCFNNDAPEKHAYVHGHCGDMKGKVSDEERVCMTNKCSKLERTKVETTVKAHCNFDIPLKWALPPTEKTA